MPIEVTPLMRVSLAASLDGYIADKNGGVDWLNAFFSHEMDFMGFMKTVGAAVMGRKTFDIAASGALGSMPATSYPTFVPTHRPMPNPPKGYEPFGGTPSDLVERLRARLGKSGKDIWLMGGGATIDAFLAAGLVDRLELRVIPVLLGDGVPLFPRHTRGQQRWRLTKHHAFKNGVVEVWYERATQV